MSKSTVHKNITPHPLRCMYVGRYVCAHQEEKPHNERRVGRGMMENRVCELHGEETVSSGVSTAGVSTTSVSTSDVSIVSTQVAFAAGNKASVHDVGPLGTSRQAT